jgi:hypothetical protein
MRHFLLFTTVIGILAEACGGAKNTTVSAPLPEDDVEAKYTAEDMVPRAVLDRAELTSAIDEKRYRAAAPIQTEFQPSDKIIYFVGKLKRVPTDATIEVRWMLDSDPTPMLVSDVQGSDSFQFAASFSPTEEQFFVGSYQARVFVNDRDVGGVPFVIGNPDPTGNGTLVSNVAFSTAVNDAMKPKKPSDKFKSGTKKLYVSFDVKGASPDTTADVIWYRGDQSFNESELQISRNQRYGAHVESPGGLPDGQYRAEIRIGGNAAAEKTVVIGNKGGNGPTVDEIELGLVLKEDNMPKKAMTSFRRDTSVIQCGFRFVDLPQSSVIEVQWVQCGPEGENLLFRNVSNLDTGGTGTMGAPWEPGYELEPGEYKVIISVNEQPLGEEPFKVE